MKIKNIIVVVLAMMTSQAVKATVFSVSLQNFSTTKVGYSLIYEGSNSGKWSQIYVGKTEKPDTKLAQLQGIYVGYANKSGEKYYYLDVSKLKIAVARVGVPIRIWDSGRLDVGDGWGNVYALNAQAMVGKPEGVSVDWYK